MHTTSSGPKSQQQTYPNPPFLPWVRDQTELIFVKVIALISFIALASSSIYYSLHIAEVTVESSETVELSEVLKSINKYISLANVIVVLGFISYLLNIRKINDSGKHRSKLVFRNVFKSESADSLIDQMHGKYNSVIETFKNDFLWFWVFILLLYLVKFLQPSGAESTDPDDFPFFPFLAYAFSIVNLFFIFRCFIILFKPETKSEKYRKKLFNIGSFLLFFLIGAYPLAWSLLSRDHIVEPKSINTFFNAFAGVSSAVILALFIGRIDSKLIGLPSGLISILYVYPAIQPFFIVFELHEGLNDLIITITMILAFVFKILFFFVIVYAMQSGRLRNYFVNTPALTNGIASIYGGEQQNRREISSWIFNKRKIGGAIIAAIIASVICYIFLKHYENLLSDLTQKLVVIIIILHILLISAFLFYLLFRRNPGEVDSNKASVMFRNIFNPPEGLEKSEKRSAGAASSLQVFKTHFRNFWLVLLLLYIVLFSNMFSPSFEEDQIIVKSYYFSYCLYPILKYILNTLSMVFIFFCFAVLYQPLVDEKSRILYAKFRQFGILVSTILILAFPSFLILVLNDKPYIEKKELANYIVLFNAISGLFNAIVLTLFIGRVESKLIGIPTRWVNLLYIYPALQPLFLAFEQQSGANYTEAAVLLGVLVLKIPFFLVITYVIITGRVNNYFYNFPTLNAGIDSIYQNHYEINIIRFDHKKFTFQINKKGTMAYYSVHEFTDRNSCEHILINFREKTRKLNEMKMIKNRVSDGLHPPLFLDLNLEGTHNVKVQFEENEFCFSKDFNSKKEARDFIADSMEKIPLCRIAHS